MTRSHGAEKFGFTRRDFILSVGLDVALDLVIGGLAIAAIWLLLGAAR